MKASIRDPDALRAISPAALAAYARNEGWHQKEPYRTHSSVYVGDKRPEIVIPRTTSLEDYASAVETLVETFARIVDQDELAVYRALTTADRDVIRVRTTGSDDGSLGIDDGVALVSGTRDLLLATACSLNKPQEVYRAGADREANDPMKLMKQMRLGQTDQDCFVVTLTTPTIPPKMPTSLPDPNDDNAPIARHLTKHLVRILKTTRQATERVAEGDGNAFLETVTHGVSANLCEALVQLVEPFSSLDIGVSWAHTRSSIIPNTNIRFGKADAPILREAARSLRDRAPQPDVRLCGFVASLGHLGHAQKDEEGSIRLTTTIGARQQSVTATLEHRDYERAVHAHRDRAAVVLTGDLERIGQRWRLLRPTLSEVIRDHESTTDPSMQAR